MSKIKPPNHFFITKSYTGSFLDKTIGFLGSNPFFIIVVALFALQALWVALSFRYSMLYDESYHYSAIKFFSQTLNPVPSTQPTSFDTSGLMIYGNASLYHYLMAFPYRLLSSITSDFSTQIIVLRIINIALAITSLYIYRKLLLILGVKSTIVNIALLAYTLLPISSLLSATISYDNLLIPLTGLFLLTGVRIVTGTKRRLINLYNFILIGLFASLVKFTFLPVFIAGVLFIVFRSVLLSRGKYKRLVVQCINRKQRNTFYLVGLLSIPLIFLIGVGIMRYGVPLVRYKTIIPSCAVVIGSQRCDKLAYYREMEEAVSTKSERRPLSVDNYIFTWINTMMTRFDTTGIQIPHGPGNFDAEFARKIPVESLLITVGEFVIFFCSIFMLHRFIRDKRWQLIFVAGTTLAVTLFIFNMLTYYSVNQNLNVQGRYMLGFVPLIIAFGLMSIDTMIKSKSTKLASLAILLLFSTQGGGVIKHIISAKSNWYWSNTTVIEVNKTTKNILDPVVYSSSIKL